MTTTPQLAPALGKQCAFEAGYPCPADAEYREDDQDWCAWHTPTAVRKRKAWYASQAAEHAALAGIANPAAVRDVIAAAREALESDAFREGEAWGRLDRALAALDKKAAPKLG